MRYPTSPRQALLAATLAVCATFAAAQPTPQPAQPAAPTAQTRAFEAAGQAAALAWLQALDAQNWAQAWDTASTIFRAQVPRQGFIEGMPGSRGALGAATTRQASRILYTPTLEGQPAGHYVSVVFESSFATQPRLEELVTTMRETDGSWRVTGYSTK